MAHFEAPVVRENTKVESIINSSPRSGKEAILEGACKKHAKNPEVCFKTVRAIFISDSSFCEAGSGARHNNCGNVRPGSGKYGDKDVEWKAVNNWRSYATIEGGINDNVALWAQLYEGVSLEVLADRWAEGSPTWLANVRHHYHQ